MNEELLRLWESEFHLADIVWENEPVQSSELVDYVTKSWVGRNPQHVPS